MLTLETKKGLKLSQKLIGISWQERWPTYTFSYCWVTRTLIVLLSISQALIQFFPCLSIVSLISFSPILEGNPAAGKGVRGPPFLPTNSY